MTLETMESSFFEIVSHTIPASHIREYPRATASEAEDLQLCVKEYIPICNGSPRPGDLTLVATHGSGLPKELYEPLWEDLCTASARNGFRIRAIWIADAAHQGASGVLNETKLGNDPSWFDHCRDIFVMVNHFKDRMPRPIIGVGHSMGAAQLILLSLMHPRLFTSLVLMEPIMDKCTRMCQGPTLTKLSTFRRDVWASREDAALATKRNHKSWDPRVVDRWMDFGLRELPTAVYPEKSGFANDRRVRVEWNEEVMYRWFSGLEEDNNTAAEIAPTPVTLTTTKHQEVFSYLRPGPNPRKSLSGGLEGGERHADTSNIMEVDRLFHPDVLGPPESITPFYRAEPVIAHMALPHVRPSVLYIFGAQSPVSTFELKQDKVSRTGTGVGGSGGFTEGRVREVVIPKAGHLLPLEAVRECSDAAGKWLGLEADRWLLDEERVGRGWSDKTLKEKTTVSDEWVVKVKSLI